jgi:hypothetical protein
MAVHAPARRQTWVSFLIFKRPNFNRYEFYVNVDYRNMGCGRKDWIIVIVYAKGLPISIIKALKQKKNSIPFFISKPLNLPRQIEPSILKSLYSPIILSTICKKYTIVSKK